MIKSKYSKYLYFRSKADEEDDDSMSDSIIIPVEAITGILPGDAAGAAVDDDNRMVIFFETYRKGSMSWATGDLQHMEQNGAIVLDLTEAGKYKEAMRDLVEVFNGNPRDKVVIVADDSTIDFDDSTRAAKYASKYISGIHIIKPN